jgi:hypothetical protein
MGHCTAPGHESNIPSQDVLEAFCNLGYATGCGWAPRERAWDAVRFAVVARSGAEGSRTRTADQSATVILIRYVCERDHRPVAHGDLEFDLSHAVWRRRHDDPRVQRMAECFLDAYLPKNV